MLHGAHDAGCFATSGKSLSEIRGAPRFKIAEDEGRERMQGVSMVERRMRARVCFFVPARPATAHARHAGDLARKRGAFDADVWCVVTWCLLI